MVPFPKKIILCYLPTTSWSLMLCPNLITVRAKGKNHLFKEVEQLKHSSSTKNAVAYNVTTRFKKVSKMLQSVRKKKNQSDKL